MYKQLFCAIYYWWSCAYFYFSFNPCFHKIDHLSNTYSLSLGLNVPLNTFIYSSFGFFALYCDFLLRTSTIWDSGCTGHIQTCMCLVLVTGHSVSSAFCVGHRSSCCILLTDRFDPDTICYMFAVWSALSAYWFLDSSCHRILFLLSSDALNLWVLFLWHLCTDSSCHHLDS